MKQLSSFIKVLGTGSSGNCYLIQAEGENLLLECGLNYKEILKGLNFNINGLLGCLVTHSHKDHCKAYKDLLKSGIDIYTNKGTQEELGIPGARRVNTLENETIKIGGFIVTSFESEHTHNDGSKCPGQCFLIYHKSLGKIVFITDSYYTRYSFKGVDHILIEANYSEDILDTLEEHRARIIKAHMSLETCKKTLTSWDLGGTKDITLIHLSKTNGDSVRYKEEVEQLTGIKTFIGEKGLIIGKKAVQE